MLGRDIYENAKRDIRDFANFYTKQLKLEFQAQLALHKAIQTALSVSKDYHNSVTPVMFSRLREIGHNAVDYYAPGLSTVERDSEVNLALDTLVHSKYHGLTLPQRLKQSHLNLRRNVRRSATVGAKPETRLLNITRVFNESYPFGSQHSWDTRLFLAEAVRLEHVIAINLAIRKEHRLVRWTLSGTHSHEDICDKLAHTLNPDVKEFIETNKVNLDPHGVYFIEDVPPIPHPNCQCVLRYPRKSKARRKPKSKKQLNLIQRIVKAIFG